MARKVMAFTAILWGLLFFVGFGVGRPALGFLPLCGLYPGGLASGDPGYNMHFITLWCVLFGIIFSVLGFVACYFRNAAASIGFLALFLVSGSIFIARLAAALNELH